MNSINRPTCFYPVNFFSVHLLLYDSRLIRRRRMKHDFETQITRLYPPGRNPKNIYLRGRDSSPALSWTGLPQSTKSLVLIVDDPDAPDPAKSKMTWVHWLLYNIPPAVMELPKAIVASELPSVYYKVKTTADQL
jgi:phosphatidylethanolamine-binding protein (PEBP) family uncharacterized protein